MQPVTLARAARELPRYGIHFYATEAAAALYLV
jgi:hypothetical protein